jgi:hypothetical protein
MTRTRIARTFRIAAISRDGAPVAMIRRAPRGQR